MSSSACCARGSAGRTCTSRAGTRGLRRRSGHPSWSGMSSSARSWRSDRTSLTSVPETWSAVRGTWSAGAAGTASRVGATSVPTPSAWAWAVTGAFAEYVALPMTNVWHHWRRHSRGGRGNLRPVRERRAHGARVPRPRRGRAGHGRRADRADGGRGRPARRRAFRRGVRAECLPAPDWRRAWAPRS